jgi:PIN domain nuclease of toxin-antitoxin system
VRLLLDTHIWIWWVAGQSELPAAEREALDRVAAVELPCISAISLWECQMLHARGRLHLEMPFDSWLFQAVSPDTVELLPLDAEVVLALDHLPARFHGDPADRIIVATARALKLSLATHDRRIRQSRAVSIWKP